MTRTGPRSWSCQRLSRRVRERHQAPRGALGAVTEVTLRTVTAFSLAETVEQVPVDQVGQRVEEIGRSAEYVKVWWMPHTPMALVFRCERTQEPMTRRPSPVTERSIENWLANRAV